MATRADLDRPDVAVVLGGAACLWADLRDLRRLVEPARCVVVAVNDAGFRWPAALDHWATLHPEELWMRREKRQAFGYPNGYRTWTRSYPIGFEARERLCDQALGPPWTDGSSGLLGVGVAREGLGIRRIVLCGMPMDGSGWVGRTGAWASHGSYRHAWVRMRSRLVSEVRSLSGWTRELLGPPTATWLGTAP